MIKDRIRQARQFVKEHTTMVACGVTAVVVYKYTHDATQARAVKAVADQTWEWGRENGVLTLQNVVMLDFINAKGLGDQLQHHIAAIGDDLPDMMS